MHSSTVSREAHVLYTSRAATKAVKTRNYLKKYLSSVFLEKAMATHSSTLAWKIPWMEEPGGLQSMGSLRVGHD